jgi:hypothetical protein
MQISLKNKQVCIKNRREEYMSNPESLKKLTRHSFRDFHKDGILDLLVGVSLLGFALWLELNIALFAYVCWLSVSFYRPLKRSLTIPRFGFVSFEEDKKQFFLGIAAAVIVTLLLLAARFLVLGQATPLSAFLRKNHPYLMSSIGAILLIGFGIWRGLSRFLAYGLVFLIIIWLCFLLEIPGQMALFGLGGGMLMIGIVLLITFLLRHPVVMEKGEISG